MGWGSDEFSIVNYYKLNVMGRGVIRNQMLGGGGGGWKKLPPTPIVILNRTVLSGIHLYNVLAAYVWSVGYQSRITEY